MQLLFKLQFIISIRLSDELNVLIISHILSKVVDTVTENLSFCFLVSLLLCALLCSVSLKKMIVFVLQTFHTPSFGDEGFDIPSMATQGNNSNTSSNCNAVSSASNSSADSIITSHTQPQPSLAYQHPQVISIKSRLKK